MESTQSTARSAPAAVLRAGQSLLAVICGYAVVALGTTFFFEVLLGGIGYYKSSAAVLAAATLGAILSGLAGGYTAAWIGRRAPLWHAVGVLLPLAIDTTYVITSGISSDPIWFDLAGSLTLMLTAVLGGYLRQARQAARQTSPPG